MAPVDASFADKGESERVASAATTPKAKVPATAARYAGSAEAAEAADVGRKSVPTTLVAAASADAVDSALKARIQRDAAKCRSDELGSAVIVWPAYLLGFRSTRGVTLREPGAIPCCVCYATLQISVTAISPALRESIVAALARGPRLRLAVLFGSQARGTGARGSDFDVGVIPVDESLSLHEELLLASALSGVTGTEVDVVRLDGAAPLLAAEVARDGVCLLEETPGAFASFRARAISEWVDFEEMIAPHRARFLHRLSGGSR
jgi:predicted nucleotidyltransferase